MIEVLWIVGILVIAMACIVVLVRLGIYFEEQTNLNELDISVLKEEITGKESVVLYHCNYREDQKDSAVSYLVKIDCDPIHVYSHPDVKEVSDYISRRVAEGHEAWLEAKKVAAEIDDIKKHMSATNYRKAA